MYLLNLISFGCWNVKDANVINFPYIYFLNFPLVPMFYQKINITLGFKKIMFFTTSELGQTFFIILAELVFLFVYFIGSWVKFFIWQDIKLDELETCHFVLVHGGGFGAWCWYKTIALLEEGGFKVTAIDLTGSGIHSSDSNTITNLAQYVKPLTDFLENLAEGEKVFSY